MNEPLAVQDVTGRVEMTGTELVLRLNPALQTEDVNPTWAASARNAPSTPQYSRVATVEEWTRWRAEYWATIRKFSHPWHSWRRWIPVRWS